MKTASALLSIACSILWMTGPGDCPEPGITLDGRVIRVVDGDTVVIESTIEYRVRLLDCWCPESRTRDPQEKLAGLKAKARMVELTDGREVRVHLPGSHDVGDMMTMGRLLGRVWVIEDGEPAERDLSSVMVGEGLATVNKQARAER